MKRMKHAALAIVAVAVLGLTAPAFAADAMKGSMMMGAADCKAMMTSMAAMGNNDMAMAKTKMTGEGEHDATMISAGSAKHMMMAAKYESKCGKTEKMRSDAADLMKALEDLQSKYPAFMHTN